MLVSNTVDGKNPAPIRMPENFFGGEASELVHDFFHQPCVSFIHLVLQGKCCLSKATPEELAAARGGNTLATAAKAKATTKGKGKKSPEEDVRRPSTKKVQPPSPAHEGTPVKSPPKKMPKDASEIQPKRLAFKGKDPEPSRQITSLQQVGSHYIPKAVPNCQHQ